MIGLSPSMLTQIEHGRTMPTDDRVIVALAEILDLDFNEMMSLAGRFGGHAQRYLKLHPTLRRIVFFAVENDLTERELKRLFDHVQDFVREQ